MPFTDINRSYSLFELGTDSQKENTKSLILMLPEDPNQYSTRHPLCEAVRLLTG
jgi:hypothetical protein